MSKKNVFIVVDGFNLYHAIDDLNDNSLKWLDLKKLALRYIRPQTEEISKIIYCSAFADWRQSVYRHKIYVAALRANNIQTIMGRFKEKSQKCKCCNTEWKAHEEKETDVNIAVQVMLAAFNKKYDRIMIISGDSDITPAIREAKKLFPEKEFTVVLPPRRRGGQSLVEAADNKRKIKIDHLKNSLLPYELINPKDKKKTTRPPEYNP